MRPAIGRNRTTLLKANPQKLKELQRLFLIEATKYNVLPLDDRRVERFNPDLAGRPTLIKGTTQLLFGGMGRLTENVVLNIKNKSHSVSAQLDVREPGPEGVIIEQGGRFGGWALYAEERQAGVLLQFRRHQVVHDLWRRRHSCGRASGAYGVQVRRRRPR